MTSVLVRRLVLGAALVSIIPVGCGGDDTSSGTGAGGDTASASSTVTSSSVASTTVTTTVASSGTGGESSTSTGSGGEAGGETGSGAGGDGSGGGTGGGDGTGGSGGDDGSGGGGAPPVTCDDVCEATYVHCQGEPAGEGICGAYCEGYGEDCQDEAITFYQCFLDQPVEDCAPCDEESLALNTCAAG